MSAGRGLAPARPLLVTDEELPPAARSQPVDRDVVRLPEGSELRRLPVAEWTRPVPCSAAVVAAAAAAEAVVVVDGVASVSWSSSPTPHTEADGHAALRLKLL